MTSRVTITLERDFLKSWSIQSDCMLYEVTNVFFGDFVHKSIKDVEDLISSVTLTKKTKCNRRGHNNEEESNELWGVSKYN